MFIEVFPSCLYGLCRITKHSNCTVTTSAQQSTHYLSGVTMIYLQTSGCQAAYPASPLVDSL